SHNEYPRATCNNRVRINASTERNPRNRVLALVSLANSFQFTGKNPTNVCQFVSRRGVSFASRRNIACSFSLLALKLALMPSSILGMKVDRPVVGASSVDEGRGDAGGGVVRAGRVGVECVDAHGGVEEAGEVGLERIHPGGGIQAAGGISG